MFGVLTIVGESVWYDLHGAPHARMEAIACLMAQYSS